MTSKTSARSLSAADFPISTIRHYDLAMTVLYNRELAAKSQTTVDHINSVRNELIATYGADVEAGFALLSEYSQQHPDLSYAEYDAITKDVLDMPIGKAA